MSNEKSAYRTVLKATSIFGGVQVFNIIVAIIRSKLVALFIGPEGMGIVSLLNTTLGLIIGATDLGLKNSAVKNISQDYEANDTNQLSKTISVLKRLVWFTAIVGSLIMIVTSSLLSQLTFNNRDFTAAFIWISIALFLTQLTNSQLAILQGLRKLKHLAKANLIGNLLGLIIVAPIYYFYELKAIVPVIILVTVVNFLCTIYFTNKIKLPRVSLKISEVFSEGKEMVKLGIMLSISSFISLLVGYIIRVFISQEGGIEEAGFYNAGYVLLHTYVGIIFTAMATDYFPRLSAISKDIVAVRKTVFEQAYIAVLLITPIIVFFSVFSKYIINILYSSEFDPIIAMVSWGILGMVFKAASFSVGYILIAKGDSSLFIKTTVVFNVLLLISNIVGYYYGGLEGLGISFFLYYVVHFIGISIVAKHQYNFYLPQSFYYTFIVCLLLCSITFLANYISNTEIKYVVMFALLIASFIYCYMKIDEKIDIKEWVNTFLLKKK